MYLSFISILFISIYTICASPLPSASSIDNISVISKRANLPELAKTDALVAAWDKRDKTCLMAGDATTRGTERAYRSKYLEQPVLIKGYILYANSKVKLDQRVKADVNLHDGVLKDFVAWGQVSNPTWGEPKYMVVIKDNSGYQSATSVASTLGGQLTLLRDNAIDGIVTQKNPKVSRYTLKVTNFVYLAGANGQWTAHYI